MGVSTPHLEDQWAIRWFKWMVIVLEKFWLSLEKIRSGLGVKGGKTEKACNWNPAGAG